MAYYPLMVELQGRRCVVVGGGGVAERKVETLLRFGAEVLVISPTLTPTLEALQRAGRILVERRPYREGDLEGAFLAIGAADDHEVHRRLSKEADLLGIPVNIVDDPDLSTFIAPAIVKKGDLVLAISTGGASPALAKRIREELEACFDEEGEALRAIKKFRERVKREIGDPERRQRLLTQVADPQLFELFRADRRAWEEALEALLQEASPRKGKVYLIGAGPGDPGLLTLKGLRCLQEADVVVYDHLVGEQLLTFAKPGARFHSVGKEAGRSTTSQEAINRLLIEAAREGKLVARLKGGDPFIFGRGGEEVEALASAGIPFEIVPGVTSAIAVPAYAGIPVTHRKYASSVAILTGHKDPVTGDFRIPEEAFSPGIDTLVILMGVSHLQELVLKLLQAGRDPRTPVAVIRWGTRAEQETVVGTLKTITAKAEGLKPPAVIVIGEVVRLRERLRWIEEKPLFGRRIVVSGVEEPTLLAALLERYGAEVVELPGGGGDLEGLKRLFWEGRVHLVVFTDPATVDRMVGRFKEELPILLEGVPIACLDPQTTRAVEGLGLQVSLTPGSPTVPALVKAIVHFSGKPLTSSKSEGKF